MSGHRCQSDQFVTLGLDQEVFVHGRSGAGDPRHAPTVPHSRCGRRTLAGLIDVRGQAVPVIDLRLKLGLPARAAGADTRILVLEVPMAGRSLSLGLIADRVFEVTALDAGSLSPPPDIGSMWRSDYIEGIGRRGDSFVVIFDVSRC